jgi:hypothetical protein
MHQNSRSQEWLNWGIRVVMAKNYIDNLRRRVYEGTNEKLAQGWSPGTPPLGYRTILKDGKRIHEQILIPGVSLKRCLSCPYGRVNPPLRLQERWPDAVL